MAGVPRSPADGKHTPARPRAASIRGACRWGCGSGRRAVPRGRRCVLCSAFPRGSDHVRPTVYQLKPRFQAMLRPAADGLASAGVTANQITIAAVVLSVGVGALPWLTGDVRVLLAMPAALFIRMALNAIDGM